MKTRHWGREVPVKAAGQSGDTLREGSVSIWIFAIVFVLLLATGRTFAEPDPQCEYSEKITCSGGSVILTNAAVNPTNACLGSEFTASVTKQEKSGSEVINYVFEDCSKRSVTNNVAVTVLSNVWTATVGSWAAAGTGLSAPFNPTNCGSGKVEFKSYWTDGCTTNIQTTSATNDFTVVGVASVTASGATEIDDGDNNPNTKTYVTCKGTGDVTVTATSCPGLSEQSLPSCWATSGGSGAAKLTRTVSKTTCGSTNVTFTAGTSSKSVTVYIVDIQSQCVATTPTNRVRTTIGVGEEVNLTVCGTPPGAVTWTLAGGGTLSTTNGTPTQLSAPDRSGNCTVTVHFEGGSCDKTFSVIEPTSEFMVTNGLRHTINRPDIGFQALCYVRPDTVNFYKIEIIEVTNNAVCTGVYEMFNGYPHDSNPIPIPMTSTVVPGRGTQQVGLDQVYTGNPTNTAPFIPGSITFNIPIKFRVGTNAWKQFTTDVQICTLDENGVLTATKAEASWSCSVSDPSISY